MVAPNLSLSSYAFHLRKSILSENNTHWHASFLDFYTRAIDPLKRKRLQYKDKFAIQFLQALALSLCNNPNQNYYATTQGQGIFQNLQEIMYTIAAIWFPELKQFPSITWSKHFSTTKLGHYNVKKNQIVISLLFDSPSIPADILYFLVYHELLHSVIGVIRSQGKQYAHTKIFRQEERRFPYFQTMNKRIQNYIIS